MYYRQRTGHGYYISSTITYRIRILSLSRYIMLFGTNSNAQIESYLSIEDA
jgi:hypothetical protein